VTRQHIAVIAGDGIGKEVMPEGVKAVSAAAARFDIELEFAEFDWSSDNYARIGAWMPADWFA
jgi:tartrate dehydrogenase/decarboxylase/D-malate dehydrogenase